MNATQAIELIDSWGRILIKGKAEQISSMLVDIEARFLDQGFARDPATERANTYTPRQKNALYYFVGGSQGGPRLLLRLNRVTECRVRGERCSALSGPPWPGHVEMAEVVDGAIEKVIIPSANEFGLEVSQPRIGPKSRVPMMTMAALVAFSDIAAGELRLSPTAEKAWQKFLITAGQEDVAFNMDELTNWFIGNGWSSEDTRIVTERFVNDSTLLIEFADAIRS